MAGVVASHRMAPLVMYRMFLLWDPASGDSPADLIPADGEVLAAQPRGVVFSSAGNDFYPRVDVEVWDGPPAADNTAWDVTAEGAFVAPAGLARLQALSGNPAGPDITLGAAGPWRLGASCRGRGEATARVGVDLFYELLAFYDFPVEDGVHLRTTKPIESTFATVRHRTKITKGSEVEGRLLAMAFQADRGRPVAMASGQRTASAPPSSALAPASSAAGSSNDPQPSPTRPKPPDQDLSSTSLDYCSP